MYRSDPHYSAMTRTSEQSALAVIPTNAPFPDAVKELCFEIWLFLADRNAAETIRILERRLDEYSEELPFPVDRVPTERVLRKWIKNEDWANKANTKIKQTAEHINETQIARLFVIGNDALTLMHRMIRGDFLEHRSPGNVAVMWDAAKEALKFLGLGTAGVVGAPTLEVKIEQAAIDLSDKTPDELAEMSRQRVLQRKELKRLTGKKN
jgi:hypothetical protein